MEPTTGVAVMVCPLFNENEDDLGSPSMLLHTSRCPIQAHFSSGADTGIEPVSSGS